METLEELVQVSHDLEAWREEIRSAEGDESRDQRMEEGIALKEILESFGINRDDLVEIAFGETPPWPIGDPIRSFINGVMWALFLEKRRFEISEISEVTPEDFTGDTD